MTKYRAYREYIFPRIPRYGSIGDIVNAEYHDDTYGGYMDIEFPDGKKAQAGKYCFDAYFEEVVDD